MKNFLYNSNYCFLHILTFAKFIITRSHIIFLVIYFLSSPKDIFFYCFLERKGESAKHQCKRQNWLAASYMSPDQGILGTQSGEWTHNLGICPDLELNQNLWVKGWCSNQLSHTGQGSRQILRLLPWPGVPLQLCAQTRGVVPSFLLWLFTLELEEYARLPPGESALLHSTYTLCPCGCLI